MLQKYSKAILLLFLIYQKAKSLQGFDVCRKLYCWLLRQQTATKMAKASKRK
jgi:hypothetical protein